jgi:hypothetical protein
MDSIEEPPRTLPVRAHCDVLVVGGGPAGISAAVAAARTGADTVLLERYGSVGGLATGGLIILLLTMDDGEGKQVVSGLCQEVIDRLGADNAVIYPPPRDWGSHDAALVESYARWGLIWGRNPAVVRYSAAYDPEAFRQVANEMLISSGVRLLFHAWGSRAIMDNGHIVALAIESKSGREAICAETIVDATGDGDVFASAGVPFDLERVHPWLWFRMAGIKNLDAAFESGQPRFFKTPPGEGRILAPWGSAGRIDRQISAVDVEDLTYAEIECRRMVMEEVQRLKRQAPGFEDAFLTDIATQLGITESRRMKGVCTLTRDEANEIKEASVAKTGNWTRPGMVYNIPYGCLYPGEVDNLLVAGRCISVDHRVHHATKEIPACFATGQAAGTAAALSARTKAAPADIDVRELRARLIDDGAYL